ncbi:MAG: hypothetical protein L6Q98_04515 [Anaerolineae bacterium]|nr:hypothetical protein [Anaerolineae bacterium]NUQ03526.1 hypothetical protein [Anaerolineae bacterium]
MNPLAAVERRRRNLRIVFVIITLGTLPFYCAGILLYLSAPRPINPVGTPGSLTGIPTNTPLIVTTSPPGFIPSNTPLGFATINIPPTQNPVVVPVYPTQGLPPTLVIVPIPTQAPTLTLFPSATPFPSSTPLPPASETPIPTWTFTWTPTPTDTETAFVEPTPIPFIEDTPIPPGP